MFATTATPRPVTWQTLTVSNCLDEGNEHSIRLLHKLVKLRTINHSGLKTVLGGLPTSAPLKSKMQTKASWEASILECGSLSCYLDAT